jgi:hypothetical protein
MLATAKEEGISQDELVLEMVPATEKDLRKVVLNEHDKALLAKVKSIQKQLSEVATALEVKTLL